MWVCCWRGGGGVVGGGRLLLQRGRRYKKHARTDGVNPTYVRVIITIRGRDFLMVHTAW